MVSEIFFFDFFVFFYFLDIEKKNTVMVAGSGYWCLASDYHYKYFFTRWRNFGFVFLDSLQ